jgi:hypothetical protein
MVSGTRMVCDIVIPQDGKGGNAEFVAMAKRLGIDDLLVLCKAPCKECCAAASGSGVIDTDVNVRCGALVSGHDAGKGDAFKAAGKDGIVVLQSSERDFALVSGKEAPRFLVGLGESPRNDKLHQRVSGVDQPLLRELKRRKVAVVLSVASLLARSGAERATLIGRWMDIIALCRKDGVRIVIASCAASPYGMRSPVDMRSIGIALGMHPMEAEAALSWDI